MLATLEYVTATLAVLAGLVLAFSIFATIDAAKEVFGGKAPFSAAGFVRGVLVFAACLGIVAAWNAIRALRKWRREASAQSAGPEAGCALACVGHPQAMKEMTPEQGAAWIAAFRTLSADVLVLDPAAAEAIGPIPPPQAEESVTIRGVPPTVAVALVLAAVVAFMLVLWITSPNTFAFGVSMLLDVVLGLGSIVLVFARQRRIGGDRVARAGVFMHGSARWTPADSLLVLRRHRMGLFSVFRIVAIGPAGISPIVLVDGAARRTKVRNLVALWLRATPDPAVATDA